MGVFCALEREKIPIDLMAGTSMGAIIGGVYAQNPRCDLVIERFRRYLESKEFQKTSPEFLHEHDYGLKPSLGGIFQRFASFIQKGYFYSQSLTRRAPISEEDFSQNINFLLEPGNIEKTQIPLAVVAADLKTGKEVVLREGPLRKAVSASSALPGILPPVIIGGWQLVMVAGSTRFLSGQYAKWERTWSLRWMWVKIWIIAGNSTPDSISSCEPMTSASGP